ncbi:hypothetical protein, partial [Salmonella sp. gx-f5]|uniref:hypothetical protein n=1 Tax=Salmonella sp. gx-f5 TaxID=2582605 RepID=UPI001F231E27
KPFSITDENNLKTPDNKGRLPFGGSNTGKFGAKNKTQNSHLISFHLCKRGLTLNFIHFLY